MNIIEVNSDVFAGDLSGTTTSDLLFGAATLEVANNADMLAKAKKQLFALWLNIVSQKVDFYGEITFDPAAVTTTASTIDEAVEQIESTILNLAATLEELENVKNMAEILNLW